MNQMQKVKAGENTKLLNVQMGAGRYETVEVQPGTTPRDVLRHLGLGNDYEIYAGNVLLGAGESLWGRVADGDAAVVSAKVDAGLGS